MTHQLYRIYIYIYIYIYICLCYGYIPPQNGMPGTISINIDTYMTKKKQKKNDGVKQNCY